MTLQESLPSISNRVPGDTVLNPGPPSLEYITALARDGEGYFKAFHTACNVEEQYYFLTRPTPAPKGAEPLRPATARAIINVATDHVDVNNLAIDVPIMERSKARGERLKRFYQGVWLNIKEPILRTAVRHSFAYGVAWIKFGFSPHLWHDAPDIGSYGEQDSDGDWQITDQAGWREALTEFMERRKLLFPFRAENINPQELVWDDTRTGPKWVVRTVESTVGDVRRKYQDWVTDRPDRATVRWREYYDDTWYAYLAGDEFVRPPTRHGIGTLPFAMCAPANSLDWDAGPPENRFQGILKPVHQLLDSEARIITQITAILRKHAWKTLDVVGPPMKTAAVADNYEMFGGLNEYPADVDVRPSPELPLPQELFSQLQMVQTMIEEATFPNVVRGLRPKGISAGFAIASLAGMGRLVFQGVADGMGRMIEKANTGFATMVETMGLSFTVLARSEIHSFDQRITPEDIKGYYENTVTLKAEAPEEREREALLARQLYSQGLISLYEAQRRIGITNPLQEQNQQAAEQMLDALRAEQVEALRVQLGEGQIGQLEQAAARPQNEGNRFVGGLPQLQRLAEGNAQRARVDSRNDQPSVFPRGLGGFTGLGRQQSSAGGGGSQLPSGGTSA